MGSVKDLSVITIPAPNKTGEGKFIFSDRYSVFDWGEMPDHIENKGASLCMVSAYFFEKLEEAGIKTHYLGLTENGKKINDLKTPTNCLKIKLTRVLPPEIKNKNYNYEIYKKENTNFLIPLEIIYRNSLPVGSSIFKRIKEGQLKLSDLGLNKMPAVNEILEKPILDVSTKLEESDRYLKWDEAQEIANLTTEEIKKIQQITLFVDKLITEEVKRIGLTNNDGKIELGFNENRDLMVVDTIGTLDECRFTYKEIPVSKEITRIYYRKTAWFSELEEAKKKDKINWKELVKSKPPQLPDRLQKLISSLYCAFCNEITQRNWFKVEKSLPEIINEIEEIIQ